MKLIVVLACTMCVALVRSNPLPEGERFQSEALDRMMMIEADNETALRNKRTIGILRELFPEASQMVEDKVNAIVAEVIRVLGPVVLQNFLGSNRAAGSGSVSSDGTTVTVASPFGDEDFDTEDVDKPTSSNGRVSVSLPTFPPDEDEEVTTTTEASTDETTSSNAERTTDVSNTIP